MMMKKSMTEQRKAVVRIRFWKVFGKDTFDGGVGNLWVDSDPHCLFAAIFFLKLYVSAFEDPFLILYLAFCADEGNFTRPRSDHQLPSQVLHCVASSLNPLLIEAIPCPRPLVYSGCWLGERGGCDFYRSKGQDLKSIFSFFTIACCHHHKGLVHEVLSNNPFRNLTGCICPNDFCCHPANPEIFAGWVLYRCQLLQHSSMKKFDPTRATRIGEAKNPGPPVQAAESFSLTCGLINPTAVRGKEQQIIDLDCHVYGLAENSATTSTQRASSNQFAKHGYKSVWSPPVAAHQHVLREEEAKRGLASGVSIHSCLPCRPSRAILPDSVDHTRIVSAIIQIEHLHIHFIVLYGFPSCHQQSRQKTNEILTAALDIMAGVNLPTVIMGDFNWQLHQLSVTRFLLSQGFSDLSDIYRDTYGEEMPSTCREVTRNDQILVSSHLSPLVRFARVDKQKLFHDHDPVIFQLELPLKPPKLSYWHLPSSWSSFEPDPDIVAEHFEQRCVQVGLPLDNLDPLQCSDLHSSLLLWTKTVEQAVDASIRQQHQKDPEKFPQPFLPSRCRGRMKPRKLKHKPLSMTIKKACDSQYDPPGEATTFHLKHMVTQTRRIQSLLKRMKKLSTIKCLWDDAVNQLLQEWKAITRAKGFSKGFPQWCMSWPELHWYPLHLPPIDYLQVLEQIMCFSTDAFSRHCEQSSKKFLKYKLQHLDKADNGSSLAKQVKPFSESFDKLSTEQKTSIRVVQDHGGLVTINISEKLNWRLDSPIMLDQHKAWIVSTEHPTMDVMLEDSDHNLPQEMTLTQISYTQNAEVIATSLNDFWNQFWKREENQPATDWSQFSEFLQRTPQLPLLQVDIQDGTLWKMAAKKMKSKTSRGVDGWYVDELRNLPLKVFHSLGQIFHRFAGQSWPPHLMKALTVPLLKKEGEWVPKNTRPITILAVLYRLWGKVVTSQILAQWKHTMPEFVVGYIPTRSPEIQMLSQQFQFETDNLDGITEQTSLQGLTLDLVKCFNLLPREPTKWALLRAGVPEDLVNTWYETMNHLHRCWKIHGTVVELELTSTGAPEGDTWSVLACISISRVWGHLVQQEGAQPACYADNWGWQCRDLEVNVQTIEITRLCAQSLRLQIDWEKTWAWKTNSRNKRIWKQAIRAALPADVNVQIVLHAKDLGFTMAYNRVQSRQTQAVRHDEALKRLVKIRKLHASLQQRAKIVADAALAKALHATETYFVGRKWLRNLRSTMARSILPDRKNTNSYITNMMVSSSVRDPELFVILRSIRACRRFLHASPASVQRQFFRFASRHSGRSSKVYGPAGALQANLHRLGWSVDSLGMLNTDCDVKFSLLYSDLKELTSFLDRSWMKHVVQCCLTRPGWTHLPVPDRKITVKALSKFPENEQQVLAYQISGSFMLAKQKKHFNDQSDGCPLCSMEDTVEHRVLTCPSLQHVRHDFPEVLQFLNDHHACHIELPVAFEDPLFELRYLYFQKCPPPELDVGVSQSIRNCIDQGEEPIFFTDGSCSHPTDSDKRRAAFAVVYHPMITPLHRARMMESFRQEPIVPDSFVVLAVGECRGQQTINRAELQAVMTIVSSFRRGTIVTDSQYVLDVVANLRRVRCVEFFQGCDNFDLISIFWQHLQLGMYNFVKVASHQLQETCQSDEEFFHRLGNEAADHAANRARQRFVHHEALQVNSGDSAQQLSLDDILKFRYALQVARARALQGLEVQSAPLRADRSFAAQIQNLKEWHLTDIWQFEYIADHDANLQFCLWGTQYAKQLLAWLSTLKWPPEKPASRGCGITWYELAVNFMITMQVGLMANISSDKKQIVLKRIPFDGKEVNFTRQVYFFERALTHLQTLVTSSILPFERQLASSTRLLGLTHGRQGLHRRPMMMHQDKTIDILVRHFAHSELPNDSPTVPSLNPYRHLEVEACDEMHSRNWTEREKALKSWRKRSKGRRAREGGPLP